MGEVFCYRGVCGMEIKASLLSSLRCNFCVTIISARFLLKRFKGVYISSSN